MKNKASGFLKQIITLVTSMAKAKTLALKTKTRSLRTRLVIFSLLRNKKMLITTITQKLNALMGETHHQDDEEDDNVEKDDSRKTMVVYNNHHHSSTSPQAPTRYEISEEREDDKDEDEKEKEEKYPDLTHSMFDLDFEDPGGSVIDIVKNSKEDKGEEFKLEDEIDRVAELFIKRFHRQMWMQKQLSFNRHQQQEDDN